MENLVDYIVVFASKHEAVVGKMKYEEVVELISDLSKQNEVVETNINEESGRIEVIVLDEKR